MLPVNPNDASFLHQAHNSSKEKLESKFVLHYGSNIRLEALAGELSDGFPEDGELLMNLSSKELCNWLDDGL